MLELVLNTPGKCAPIISDALFDLGAAAITFRDAKDNPIFEPDPKELPLWPSITLSAIFEQDISLDFLLIQLSAVVDSKDIQSANLKSIEEQDWIRETQRLTQPMCFGEKLWIYPSWHEPPADDAVKILLDPGLAFGTGTHATTSLMLTWLALNPPRDFSVLDYGCGSGVLAIAAAKLNANKIIGVDIDTQALLATRENAARNDIFNIELYLPLDLPANLKVDLILANILAEPLLELAPKFAEYLQTGGLVVISGVLVEQVGMLEDVYKKYFDLKDVQLQCEWGCMIWEKKDKDSKG